MNRRQFTKSAAVMAGASLLRGAGKPMRAYVGTYSSPQGPEGSKGRGSGIYLLEMDPTSGALTQRSVYKDGSNPSWIALNRTRTCLYAADETETGAVSAFSIDSGSGELTLLNRASSGGAGPAHLSIHPLGKHVLVANYAGGTVAVLPIYSASEDAIPGVTAEALTARIEGPLAQFVPDFAAAVSLVVAQASEGDLILTLGAGNVSRLGPLILSALEVESDAKAVAMEAYHQA